MSDIHRRFERRLVAAADSEKAVRGMLPFRSRKLDFSDPKGSDKKGALGSRKRENETPEESYVSPRKKAPAQLPEKYSLLESFYEGVEAAISLLGIRRQLCTFQAVCATVEATTKRRFLQKHLAQIKYVLPEAVDLEYVRSYDQDTRSKKWEMKITLLPMPAEAEEPPSEVGCSIKRPKIESVQRRRAFHSRLVKFASSHPEGDDVPAHPLPERTFLGNSASKGSISGMPAATTCIPMEINTAVHRVDVPEADSVMAASTHFSRSFKSSFSSKAEKPASGSGSFLKSEKSSTDSGLLDTILPMPINRTPHRDVHTLATMPTGTPHLAPSFSPFFSVKRSLSEPELASENDDNVTKSTVVEDMPSSVQLTPMKRRHAGPEEEPEIVAPIELRTPIKVIRTCGTPKGLADEMESPSKRPHFSPAFKPHFSVGSSPLNQSRVVSRSLLSTPVKPSPSLKGAPISWEVRTPGRASDAVDRCSPIEECSGLKTPVKSSIPVHSFKSPAPVSKHLFTPCTPRTSEGAESSIDVSYHATQPGSVCQEGFRSPAATPVKQGSSSRSLNFASPKSSSKGSGTTGTPCPCSPGMDVPSTPGVSTPVNPSRASRFRNKVAMRHSKLNLGPLFARTSDDDAGSSGDETNREDSRYGDGMGSVSRSCITEKSSSFFSAASASASPALRKSLSFSSEVSQSDLNLLQGLPADLVHSVIKEELKVAEEKNKDIAGLRRRQQMMAGLPHLFNQLRLIFQSSNKSVFPYKELLAKVVSSNTELTDRSEVEERLKMLMELAPEWLSAKKSLAGDMLYRIDKKADVISVRKKLCEAL